MTRITLRLSEKSHQLMKWLAARHYRSLNSEIAAALNHWTKSEENIHDTETFLHAWELDKRFQDLEKRAKIDGGDVEEPSE